MPWKCHNGIKTKATYQHVLYSECLDSCFTHNYFWPFPVQQKSNLLKSVVNFWQGVITKCIKPEAGVFELDSKIR